MRGQDVRPCPYAGPMALQTSADSPAPLRQVSQLIEGYVGRLGPIWVEGQVTEVNRRPGVCFLTVRDLLATVSISVTCSSSVLDASPAPVTEGSRVVLHAKPTFYLPTGRLSLEAREIRPVGEGELLARLERRKQLLAAEGLFDPAAEAAPAGAAPRHRLDHRPRLRRRARRPRERS